MAQVPSYFIRTRNVSNSVAGAYLVPTVLGNASGALIGGWIINRYDETHGDASYLKSKSKGQSNLYVQNAALQENHGWSSRSWHPRLPPDGTEMGQ